MSAEATSASMLDGAESRPSAEYDLSPQINPFLDPHLMIPILDFVEGAKMYSDTSMKMGKLKLLESTNMVDFALDIWRGLNPDEEVPEEMLEKRDDVLARMVELKEAAAPALLVVDNEELVQSLVDRDALNGEQLEAEHHVNADVRDALYHYSKFQFECGQYDQASKYLGFFRLLVPTDTEQSFSALWGQLAAAILTFDWETAFRHVQTLRDQLDEKAKDGSMIPLMLLQQRSWLLHWSLFVFFNHPSGRAELVELFLKEHYLNAIQTNCPWLLRYVAVCSIVSPTRRSLLRDLKKVVEQETYTYCDPVTEFVHYLFTDLDFDGAQERLAEAHAMFASDFFLSQGRDAPELLAEFTKSARLLVFETYCQIHQKIDIGMLASKVHMTVDAAERWIVELVRNAQFEAKIDAEHHTLVMTTPRPSVYRRVVEMTRDMPYRCHSLISNLERVAYAAPKEEEEE
jgi:translation initiation factor 3 subunit E